jgi:hypothetical protein
LQKEITQAFDKFLKVDGVGGFAGVFAVADEFHDARLLGGPSFVIEILRRDAPRE